MIKITLTNEIMKRILKIEENKSNTHEECVHPLTNTNNHNYNSKTTNQKRNINNLHNNLNINQKHSFLTH